jgi:hypothetical protein
VTSVYLRFPLLNFSFVFLHRFLLTVQLIAEAVDHLGEVSSEQLVLGATLLLKTFLEKTITILFS